MQALTTVLDKAQESILWKYRQSSWRYRVLPHFIIIGAHKCGTTSLHHYLESHPQLRASYIKEIHFFDGGLNPKIDSYAKGEPWYRSHFPFQKELKDKKTYESSPLYLFNPHVAERMATMVPNVKLIILLRNPSERAISHYFQEIRSGREQLPIMKALQLEEKRLKPILEKQDYKNEMYRFCSYKKRGHYLEQINRFLKFFDLNDMLIIKSEMLFTNPHCILRQICQFLDIDPDYSFENLEILNKGNKKTKISTEVYEYLNNYFKPLNQELYAFMNKSFKW